MSSIPFGGSLGQVQNLRPDSACATDSPGAKGSWSVHFQELVPLRRVGAPDGIRVGRGDCRRGGLRECSIWDPAARAGLWGLRGVWPLLPAAQPARPTHRPYSSCGPRRPGVPSPRPHLPCPAGRSLPGLALRAPPLAPERQPQALRPRAGGPGSASRWARGRSGTSWSRRRGARRPAPGGPGGGVLSGRAGERASGRAGGRPCFAGYLRAAPAPPRRPGSGPPRPAAGFVHRPAAAPPRSRRLLPAPSTPAPLPRSGGAGGGSGPGTKGLSRALPGAEGSGAQPSAVLRPLQRKKCPPEETHKFYSGGPPARPGRKGRPGPRAASPARIRELARGKVTRAAGRCQGQPEPAPPAKVNFNRGGWMRRRGGR